jgi:hypothetical protein
MGLRPFLLLAMIMLAATADERWLDMTQLADRWHMEIPTLRDWRAKGFGPQGVKFGEGRSAPVRYRLSEIQRFEAELEAAVARRLGAA